MDNHPADNEIRLFRYYKMLADKALEPLSDAQISWLFNDRSNSIAVIVRHMSGNMLSRFTNFLTEDGEKPWRDRDGEFSPLAKSKAELMQEWEKGWTCLFDALEDLRNADMQKIVFIRHEGHTVAEAVSRQLAHYSYHVGQIVYVAKMLSDHWEPLTIPPNGSGRFNEQKFTMEKMRKHFTDEVLKRDPENEQ